MTATTAPAGAPAPGAPAAPHRISVARGYRFELVKLLSQWRVRLLILACWIGPGLLVVAVSQQASLPADTLFGRWMHATGWAGALVVRLVHAGIAPRELAPVVSPLEAAFLALTEQEPTR